jgi:hypothetical protein
MKRGLLLVAAVTLGLVAGAGCKPKIGGSCKIELKEVCADEKTALACHDGKWEEMSCRGPNACSKEAGEHPCDQSVAEPGDVCNLVDDYVCTADKKGMLQCTKNKWTLVQSCLGERACAIEKGKVTQVRCDDSVASAGDACREEDDYACSVDKKLALVCRKGKFVQASFCRGPKGCQVVRANQQDGKVECDDSIAVVGDLCETEEHYSCSSDDLAILKCKNKKFELEERCRAREKCQIRGGQVGCY